MKVGLSWYRVDRNFNLSDSFVFYKNSWMLLMKKIIKFKRGKNMSNNNKGGRGETEKLSEAPKTLRHLESRCGSIQHLES